MSRVGDGLERHLFGDDDDDDTDAGAADADGSARVVLIERDRLVPDADILPPLGEIGTSTSLLPRDNQQFSYLLYFFFWISLDPKGFRIFCFGGKPCRRRPTTPARTPGRPPKVKAW